MMITKRILSWLSIAIFSWAIAGCSNDTIETVQAFDDTSKAPIPHVEKISEVSPPRLITQLNKNFAQTKPQVKIISPTPDQIVKTQNVKVKLEVQGLKTFKNEELKMGPHLHFFVDDQPYQAIYNTDKPIILSDLTPGTHTLRVFASRPWHESFKNRGAYAKTTFHVFTVTEENNPSPTQPLLTYSRPQGSYGAQPIMLDFYLTDAPLHVVAQESPDDDIADWRIRVTVNGESFLLDQWRPLYLQGFDEGQNWVKLEFIDENGTLIKNVFNSTVRAITYDPQLKDTLTKLVTGDISLEKAQAVTIANYQIKEQTVTKKIPESTPQIELIAPIESIPATESTPPIELTSPTESMPSLEEEKVEVEIEKEETLIEEVIPEENISEDNLLEEVPADINENVVKQEDLEIENQIDEPITQVEEDLEIETSSPNSEEKSIPDEQLLNS